MSMNKKPIQIPDHPYKTEITSFGRDEMVWLLFNTVWTLILNFFVTNVTSISWVTKKLLLAVWWPVVEKIGLFLPHLCIEIYKQKKEHNISYKKICHKTFFGWWETLVKDLLLHDPLYIVFMYILQEITPQTPIILLSFISFIFALLLVGLIKISFDEWRYKIFTRKLLKKWFQKFTYYESRIYIPSLEEAKKVFDKLITHFGIKETSQRHYTDTYYDANIMRDLWWRTWKVRSRVRTSHDHKTSISSGQIVFTKAKELTLSQIDQYRYFPIKKEKYIYYHDNLEHITTMLKPYKKPDVAREVSFSRFVAEWEKGLLVTLDSLRKNEEEAYLIEIKIDKDLYKLKEVIRFILRETAGEQHTHGKDDL